MDGTSEYLRHSMAGPRPETAGVEALTGAGATAGADPDHTADPGLEAEVEADALDPLVETGQTAEVLEDPGPHARPPRAPGGPEAEVPEPAGPEVLKSQQVEAGAGPSRDPGQPLPRRRVVEREVAVLEHQPALTERDYIIFYFYSKVHLCF